MKSHSFQLPSKNTALLVRLRSNVFGYLVTNYRVKKKAVLEHEALNNSTIFRVYFFKNKCKVLAFIVTMSIDGADSDLRVSFNHGTDKEKAELILDINKLLGTEKPKDRKAKLLCR